VFKHEQLIHCQERKAALLRECAGHRRLLVAQAQPLRAAAEWVDRGIAVTRKARASWLLLTPLLFLRKTRKQASTGFVHRLAEGISLARSIMTAWKNWR
jgi:hypothetical protein